MNAFGELPTQISCLIALNLCDRIALRFYRSDGYTVDNNSKYRVHFLFVHIRHLNAPGTSKQNMKDLTVDTLVLIN